MNPSVSVIIPTRGNQDGLLRCLEGLDAQSYAGGIEIVVVENVERYIKPYSSQRHSLLQAFEPIPASYRARNHGVALSSGEILAFIDDDCFPDIHWLSFGVSALRSSASKFVGGGIRLTNQVPPNCIEQYEVCCAMDQQSYVQEQGFAATANLLVRREDFLRVGYFNSGMKSSGDLEWGVRAGRAGLGVSFVPEAFVSHPARSSWRSLLLKTTRVAVGRKQCVALDIKLKNPFSSPKRWTQFFKKVRRDRISLGRLSVVITVGLLLRMLELTVRYLPQKFLELNQRQFPFLVNQAKVDLVRR